MISIEMDEQKLMFSFMNVDVIVIFGRTNVQLIDNKLCVDICSVRSRVRRVPFWINPKPVF